MQLRTFHEHTTFRDTRFEDLDSKQLRVMIATFLKKAEIYTQQDLEPHYQVLKEDKDYMNFFHNEGILDVYFQPLMILSTT